MLESPMSKKILHEPSLLEDVEPFSKRARPEDSHVAPAG